MATMITINDINGELSAALGEDFALGDAFEMECYLVVQSLTQTTGDFPVRAILTLHEVTLNQEEGYTPPEPEPEQLPAPVPPPEGAEMPPPTPPTTQPTTQPDPGL